VNNKRLVEVLDKDTGIWIINLSGALELDYDSFCKDVWIVFVVRRRLD
jgi:hypothetical protein